MATPFFLATAAAPVFIVEAAVAAAAAAGVLGGLATEAVTVGVVVVFLAGLAFGAGLVSLFGGEGVGEFWVGSLEVVVVGSRLLGLALLGCGR